MDESGDGYRRFLEVQVEALQEHLYALERDPEQLEHLKSILRVCQRVRHAQAPDEPEPVRLLRNAVEKVTLHLGRADLAVTQDYLDFYVDSFDLLEEAIRRWPGGAAFDRARYADRVRSLIERSAPRRAPAAAQPAERLSFAPRGRGFGEEATAESPLGDETELTPSGEGVRGEAALEAPAGAAELADVPTWRESAAGGGIEVLDEADLDAAERDAFIETDLRELLAEPWRGRPEREAAAPAGGLAASFSTFEALRSEPDPEVEAALTRLRDVLDALSLCLSDLEGASDRLLREDWGGLGRETVGTLVERLEGERDKLFSVFERTIESFRAGAV